MCRARSLLASSVVAALILAGCDSGPKPGEEALYWGPKVLVGELAKRDVAMKHLSELKDKRSLPFLYDALKQPVPDLKPEAVQLIGMIGDESSVEALVSAIDFAAGAGRSKEERFAATTNERVAKALARLGKASDAKAIEALKRLAGSNNQDVQLAAVVALGELKATDAVEDLIEVAEGHPNNFMVKNAIEALGKIGDARAVPVLIRNMFFERTGVSFYREASYALFQIGKPAVQPMIELYQNKRKEIEEFHVDPAFQKAKAVVVLGDLADPAGFPSIIDAANYDGPSAAVVRIEGWRAASRLGLDKITPALMKQWDNVDISQSEHALFALALLGRTELAGDLFNMTTHDGYLAQCKAQDNPEDRCKFSEAQVRKQRLLVLSRIAPGSDVPRFEKMAAEEQNADLKKSIEEAKDRVVAAAACDGKGLECWSGKLKDGNPRVRERAVFAILSMNDDKSANALIEAIGDQDNEARYAAIVGVLRRLPKDSMPIADKAKKLLDEESGKTQFIRVNEDLKRLEIRARRGH